VDLCLSETPPPIVLHQGNPVKPPIVYRLFALPTVLISVSIILVPALFTYGVAFFKWDGIRAPRFVGFANFQQLFADRLFWNALGNNVIWMVIFLTIPIALGFVAAAMLLATRRGSQFFQVIYFLPVVIATTITARVWQLMIYSPASGINGVLQRMGLPTVDPLGQPSMALFGVAAVDIWHWWGFLCVVFFAAMRQVPQDHIDAARIDGAGFWQLMRYVLMPGILPTMRLMMIMTIIWSFLSFDFIYILTQGGPGSASEVLATFAYDSAFKRLAVGKAAAISVVISMFGLITTWFYIWTQKAEVET
jgi:raffinose/stachyose/melibiose transport system permease protein